MANFNDERDPQAPPAPKIVGPNITGKLEEYRLERRLQAGLFGGVYEAKGLSSGRLFAVKVLHRSELHKAQKASSLEFCEVPLSEIKFIDLMRNHDHIMQVEDNFEDQYCHYIVFECARGGDLLEALKLKPHGFEEHQAQFLIGQAARGLVALHDRGLAMQDVSLENMLLHVKDDGEYQVKICDPGQAVQFEIDAKSGEEIPVNFSGFVGKSFRPPEIHQRQPYYGSKVDAWCLGWSTFYLIAAQPLFLSANPSERDQDWELFEKEQFATLFRQKATSCSQQCIDFILKLLVIDPKRRLSVRDALQHEWLRDSNSRPMYAPRELLPSGAPTKEVGHSSPAPGGNPNGSLEESQSQGLNISGVSYSGGGLAGSLGGGRSSQLLSNGAPSSDWQPNRHRNNQGGALAWKMAPSRSESPGPGSTMRQGYYQGRGSAGTPTPTPNQYAPTQARAPSPFGASTGNSGFVPLKRRSPSPPPRPNPSLVRNTTGTNVYGGTRDPATSWPDLGNQSGTSAVSHNSHTPRLARISGMSSTGTRGVTGDRMEYTPEASVPTQMGSTRESREHNSDTTQIDSDARFGKIGGSGWHTSGSSTSNAPRPHSPMHQQNVVARSQNVRGFSPSPIRNASGSETAWAVPGPVHRSGSPMTHQHHPSTLEAARSNSGASTSQFWPSPRAASPSSGVSRAPEVFSRGRSNTRALSPSQQIGGLGSNTGHSSQAIAGGVVRTLSPGGMFSRTAGIAWSPVPPSPLAPTRSISPQPSYVHGIVAGQPNSSSVNRLTWNPF